MSNQRIQIFTGAYGSGKTEVSMNHAVELRKVHEKVALIDLDIVNPYFRSREAAGPLREAGVEVVFPSGALASADLPAISPDINRVLQDEEYQVVFDVGGDNVGATALGRFKPYFAEGRYDMNFVINTLRPFTREAEGIREIMEEVALASRIRITHLVANINLVLDTRVDDILSGYRVIKEVADIMNIPVKYLAAEETLKGKLPEDAFETPVRYIHLFNRPDWLKTGG